MRSFDSGLTASAQDDTVRASGSAVRDDAGRASGAAIRDGAGEEGAAGSQRPSRPVAVATWVVRVCFAFVFVVNVQCALGFVLAPEAYMGAYELSGVAGHVAAQGIGVAFLMWNCTYPAFIVVPRRFPALGVVILTQQMVGLIGESAIRATLPAGHDLLASSIDRFIAFDVAGLVLMGASFALLALVRRSAPRDR